MTAAKKLAKKRKFSRNYSPKTLKVLFALSGNQCAHPDCTNPVIIPPTEASDVHVSNQICHIYSLNAEARTQDALTEKELNAPENLILFCPTHHGIIDGQHETYPPDLLKQWKQEHEEKIKILISRDLKTVPADVLSHPYFPRVLVDQKIQDEVETLRKSRFFVEFDRIGSSQNLARKLVEGELSGGTDTVRAKALAWCGRLLSRTEHLAKAEEYLNLARALGNGPEIRIADAFISSEKGDKSAALGMLAAMDAPMARSAALMVVGHHDGAQAALDWMRDTGTRTDDLDSDGKNILLMHQLQLGQWDAGRETVDAFNDADLSDTPVLCHRMAITHLLGTVPDEFRDVVLGQLPLQPAHFPLADDRTSIAARRRAREYFVRAAEIARELDCPKAAIVDDEYALWLELRDPDQRDSGMCGLQDALRDRKQSLRMVHLGLQFGLDLDMEAVAQEIEREIALHGGMTLDAAMARFALAFRQRTPEQAASYIARHRDELSKFLDKKSMQFLEIELLSRSGQPERATERLGALLEEGLSGIDEGRLRRIIAEAEGTDPIEARRQQFAQTDSLSDLASLVDELERRCEWDELSGHAETLFQRTRSLQDAERLAKALSNANNSERVVAFIRENMDLLTQSRNLQMLYSWALYHQGELLEARQELSKLGNEPDDRNYRALLVNLAIALGDWNSLSAYLSHECQQKENRTAQDLMGAAQLALHLGSLHAKELLFAAAVKAGDNAALLAAAYTLASSGGWEDEPGVHEWLHRAAELSGDDGPIQKMSLQDVLDRKPEWERREAETWELLSRGDIPMFLAAQALNRSLVDLMLFPALANRSETDPRRRGAIPAYSGKKQPVSLELGATVGIDATVLLTLGSLNLLDQALDAFSEVYLPHSTLSWLFEEKQKAAFHQPSRIRSAHRVRDLLATERLERFMPETVPDSDLSAHVGDVLAHLIAEAEKQRETGNTQCVVVRSSPVHRIASLMGEEADLTAHADVLSSCQAVVDKLRQKGQITGEEAKKAKDYLRLHEKPWPDQPEIADGAVLYLDDLAITYLLHLGMLEKLKAAGFRAIASPREVDETNQLISYERTSGKVNEVIDRIRSSVAARIETGKIRLGARRKIDGVDDWSATDHPSVSILALAGECDFILIDDRFLNQHANIEHESAQARIACTLDLLDTLASSNALSCQDYFEYRTLIRQAGYFFVPLDEEELEALLDGSLVTQGKLVETAELRAIRENLLRVRMSTWLQLPKEAPWLDVLLKMFVRVLKRQWSDTVDIARARARSDWIIDQIDVRGWAHSLGGEGGDNLIKTGRVAHIMLLLSSYTDLPPESRPRYWDWIEERLLVPIKEEAPELYAQIVEAQRQQVAYFADADLEVTDGE